MDRPWLKHYDSGVPENIAYPQDVGLYELFTQSVALYSDRPALIYYGRRISYQELNDWVKKYATILSKFGVQKGDRVALCLPNIPQFAIAYLAILRLGAVVVPVNIEFKGDELIHVLSGTQSKVVITISKFVNKFTKVASQIPANAILVTSVKEFLPGLHKFFFIVFKENKEGHRLPDIFPPNFFDLDQFFRNTPSRPSIVNPPASQDEIVLIQHSSGSTGEPKLAVHTHRTLIATVYQNKNWLINAFVQGGEVIGAILLFFHIYGQTTILLTGLLTGATLVLFPDPREKRFWKKLAKAIRRYLITILPGVPLVYERMLAQSALRPRYLRSLKLCISGGRELDPALQQQFERATGAVLIEGYGASECPVITIPPVHGQKKIGSIGLPISDTDVLVIDDNGQPLGAGKENRGELIVKSPAIMIGYWQDQEATSRVIKDGWLHTGDVGWCDNEGFFYFTQRKKHIIKTRSGHQVFPFVIERIIGKHPWIDDVAVFGAKQNGDEIAVACIVISPKQSHRPPLEICDSVLELCREKLASYEVPRRVVVVPFIPKNPFIGKPLIEELKAMVQKQQAAQ